MAIASMDELLAGMMPPVNFRKVGTAMEAAGVLHSFFYTSGLPGAAAANGQALAGAALTSAAGQLPFGNPSGGDLKYLAGLAAMATSTGCLLLCDRLWHNDSIAEATTTAQTINSATFPARDRNGSTNGDDIQVAIEVSSATTNGSAVTNTTMSYTDSDGNSGNTATITSFPATAQAGTFVPFQLAAGDKGVRSIQSLTLGTSYAPSGTPVIHLVAYRVLARLEFTLANTGNRLDAITGGLPRLFDDTVPFLLWLASGTTATTVDGQLLYSEG